MKTFNRQIGKKERRSCKTQILPVFRAVLLAKNSAEFQRILKQHPELLSAKVDALLGEFIAQSDEEIAEPLNAFREFFGLCREVGIDKAFADQTRNPIPPELEAIVHEAFQLVQPADLPARIHLFQKALALVHHAPPFWAVLHNELGNSLAQNRLPT